MILRTAFATACAVAILCFIANFGIFVLGYDRLAVPFLSEEQRVENANFIMSTVIGLYAIIAGFVGVFVYRLQATRSEPPN